MQTKHSTPTNRERILPLLIFTVLTGCFYAVSVTDMPTRKTNSPGETIVNATDCLFKYRNL